MLRFVCRAVLLFLAVSASAPVTADPEIWANEWPQTDFAKAEVPLEEIRSVIAKDAIPAIDEPVFAPVGKVEDLPDSEPVIGLELHGERRAYPLRILIWHEIVNDVLAGTPVAVTFCPLCNTSIVFERTLDGSVLDFGVTGKLRHSDLVMYDRQTEGWWQQFTGEAIVGELAGRRLKILPARLESFADFRRRAPRGEVLLPPGPDLRPYGQNPYAGYDSSHHPFLFDGDVPENLAPLARVVTVGDRAWTLALLQRKRRIETPDGLVLQWHPGQNSALDDAMIAEGRDVGSVIVQRRRDGALVDVPYSVDFAFAFHAFHPEAPIISE